MSAARQMTIVYLSETRHLLAALDHSAGAPELEALARRDGLHLSGLRGRQAPNVIEFGAKTSQDESFVVPLTQLAQKRLPFELDVFVQPHAYLVDSSTVAKLPPTTDQRSVRVELSPASVGILSTDPGNPNSLSFPVDTKVFLQVEGPSPSDRRVMRGKFPANHPDGFHFPLTVEPDGPLAPIATARTYFVLVMIEGQAPDARTVKL